MKTKNIITALSIIAILGCLALIWDAIPSFLNNHTYYQGIRDSGKNRSMLLMAIFCASFPLIYIGVARLQKNRPSRWGILITLLVALLAFSRYHTAVKAGPLGVNYLGLTFNTLLLVALGIGFIVSMYTLGSYAGKHIPHWHHKQTEKNITDQFLTRGLGLGLHLIVIYILALLNILWRPITLAWTIFLGYTIYKEKKALTDCGRQILDIFMAHKGIAGAIIIALLLMSIMYFLYSFNLSFVPYSTARDANHLYMYMPKIWSQHHGVFWSDGPWSPPYLWLMYILYWFSLTEPLREIFWLAPDTFAVNLNAWSGIFVLALGLGLIDQVTTFLKIPQKQRVRSLITGWIILLLWLTSGMGAFLVFVDNKTDLGIMTLVILALISGFYILNRGTKLTKKEHIYIIASGFFFALAALAKPTSLQDIALTVLLMIGLWGGITYSIGGGFLTLGVIGLLKFNGAALFLTSTESRGLIIIGIIVTIAAVFIHKKQQKNLIKHATILGKWILGCVLTILILRAPYLVARITIDDIDVTPKRIINNMLMGYQSDQTENIPKESKEGITATIIAQDMSRTNDTSYNTTSETQLTPTQCTLHNAGFDDTTQLYSDLKNPQGKGMLEDMGRYVGYGRRPFTSGAFWIDLQNRFQKTDDSYYNTNLGYHTMRFFFNIRDIFGGQTHNGETCFAIDPLAKKLCALTQQHGPDLSIQHLDGLTLPTEREDVEATQLSQTARRYLEDHSAIMTKDTIAVPYRRLVPYNIVFNRSLQNLSSYYTDIGFVWIFVYLLIGIGLIAAIIKQSPRDILIHTIAIVGWIIRRHIAMGIVRYGIGLFLWSTMSVISTISLLTPDNKKDQLTQTCLYLLIGLLSLVTIYQLTLNFLRISSQGAGGNFAQYKGSVGIDLLAAYTPDNRKKLDAQGIFPPHINPLQYSTYIRQLNAAITQGQDVPLTARQRGSVRDIFATFPYTQDHVFELQFPFYRGFIEHTKDRNDNDGVFVAGTYLSYFLDKHTNHKYDGLVSWLGKMVSDNDTCASYLRLRDNDLRYLVIDPNIASVVQGEGNKSLFHRFFGEISEGDKKTLTTYGALTMMMSMHQQGYADLRYSNNLAIKYAFELSDAELQAAIQLLPTNLQQALAPYSHDPILLRSIIMTPNYAFWSPELRAALSEITGKSFLVRLQNGEAIGDIADIDGKIIRENVLTNLIRQSQEEKRGPSQREDSLHDLTPSEIYVLENYYVMITLAQNQSEQGQQQFQTTFQSFIRRAISSQSQIMIMELR